MHELAEHVCACHATRTLNQKWLQGDCNCNDHDHAQNRDEDDVGWNDENNGANDVFDFCFVTVHGTQDCQVPDTNSINDQRPPSCANTCPADCRNMDCCQPKQGSAAGCLGTAKKHLLKHAHPAQSPFHVIPALHENTNGPLPTLL